MVSLGFRVPSAGIPSHVLQPVLLDNKSFTEIYTLSAFHDDHTFVQIQLTITNLGTENNNAACKALVLHPPEKPWKANKNYNRHQWNYSDVPDPALSVGSSTITLHKDNTQVVAILGGGSVDITLAETSSPVKPPHTDFPKDVSGKFYSYDMIIPWSKLKTTITMPGKPPYTMQGYGMLDRARSVGTSRDICRGWVTFRGYGAGNRFCANFRLPPQENSPAVGWTWKNGDTKPVAMTGIRIQREFSIIDGKGVQTHWVYALDNSFAITGTDLLYRYSFVDELGSLTGFLVKMVIGKPITTYYKAQARFDNGKPAVSGILELMTIE
jgi:hypothetical protein